MKILFVTDSLSKGGSQRRMIELVKNLALTTNHKATLICLSEHVDYNYVYDLPINFIILKRRYKKDPSVFFRLLRIIRTERPDVIHSWSSMSNLLVLPIAKMLNIRFITSVIADAPNNLTYRNKAYFRAKMVFPFADKITSNSLAGLKAYKAPMKKSLCIYNGFDSNRLSALQDAASIRKELGVENKIVIGMVAGFEDRKDYETLIAAEAITRKKTDVVFLLIGDGYTRKKMEELVSGREKEQIRFLGKIHNVESYINIFDIGVLCTNSKVHQEGVSNSILEYMALEKPVVATEGGGTNEIVVDGETGFLVPAYNPGLLENRLLELIINPALRQEFGRNGYHRIRESFSITSMCTQFYSLYNEVVQS